MRTNLCLYLAIPLCLLFTENMIAQDTPVQLTNQDHFPTSFFSAINKRADRLEGRIAKQTEKYMRRLYAHEKKLYRKLSTIDSAAAQRLSENSQHQYELLNERLKKGDALLSSEYLPGMDSIKTSLLFLQKNSQWLANAKEISEKVNGSLSNISILQNRLQESERVKAFILQRKQQIKEVLGKYTHLPKGITNSFSEFNKQAYYYNAQVNEYREMLNDPDRMMRRGFSLLNKLPLFQKFMQEHSELASLFRLPEDYGSAQSLSGLQTRTQVQQQIQSQLSSAGPNAGQYMQQNIQAAQNQLNQLKDKINKAGGGAFDEPDFRPNTQKTKTFWQRLEYGTNFQSTKSNFLLPSTSDIGLSLAYKINDKSSAGIGASYKVGWGKDFQHIAFSNEGIGLRSFIDLKLKGSLFASGGYEYNYQPLHTSSTNAIQASEAWHQSALLGITKIVSLKTKFFKKTRLQLLLDLLSQQQLPKTQLLKFRVGYNF